MVFLLFFFATHAWKSSYFLLFINLFSAQCHISQNRKFLWLFHSLAMEICMWTCPLNSAMKLFSEGWKRNAYRCVQLKLWFIFNNISSSSSPTTAFNICLWVSNCDVYNNVQHCSTNQYFNSSIYRSLLWLHWEGLVVGGSMSKNFWPDALHFAYGLLNPKLMTIHSMFCRRNDQSLIHLFFLFALFSLAWEFSTEADLSLQLQ